VLVLLADVVSLAQVDEIDDRLSRQEEERVDNLDLLWRPVTFSDILSILEHSQDLLDAGLLLLELLHLQALTTAPGLLDELLQRLLNELDVLEP